MGTFFKFKSPLQQLRATEKFPDIRSERGKQDLALVFNRPRFWLRSRPLMCPARDQPSS